MRYILVILSTAISMLPALAQEDTEAIRVLNLFASVARDAPSISIDFRMTTIDTPEKQENTIDGSLVISGDKYRLTLPESTTWFNGTDSWNYMPSVNEVTISRPAAGDVSFFSKPSMLFEMHKQDYKARLIDETAANYIVDLYPADIKSEMIRVRLTIIKTESDLISAEYKTKNGITIVLNVKEYNLKFRPDGKYFEFNPDKYKGIEIIDMR